MLNHDNYVTEFRVEEISRTRNNTTQADHRYEHMKPVENHVGGCPRRRKICPSFSSLDDRPSKKLVRRPCYDSSIVEDSKFKPENYSLNKNKQATFVIDSRRSPTSDITTEYMAESSKSSCFDDACALSLDPPTGESGGSTSELHKNKQQQQQQQPVDFNNRPSSCDDRPITEDEQAADDEQPVNPTSFAGQGRRETLAPAKDEEGKGESEVFLASGGGKTMTTIDYQYTGKTSDWLQLGLGPHHRMAVTTTTTTGPDSTTSVQATKSTNADNDDVLDDEQQQQQQVGSKMLRLFPAKPEYEKPTASSTRWDDSSSSAIYHQQLGADYSTRFMSREAASRQQAEDYSNSSGFTGFLRHQNQQVSDHAHQHIISYGNMPPHFEGVSSDQFLRRPSSEQQFSEQAAAPGGGPFGYGLSETYFQNPATGSSFDDNRLGRGNRLQQELHSSGGFQHTFHHQAGNRPGFYVPAASGIQGPPPPPPARMNNQASEEWQALVKRLHLQSLYRAETTDHHPESSLQQQIPIRGTGSSNLQDLQAQWNNNNINQEFINRSAWSNRGAARMPFSLEALGSRIGPPSNPQGWQQQQRAGLQQLPYFPPAMPPQNPHSQRPAAVTCAETSSSKEMERNKSPATGKDHDLWFYLRAATTGGSVNQDSEHLPQILKGYLRVKDGTVPVSYVKKYLAHKLGLLCESEVEISCRGQIIMPTMSLQHVRDVIWYSSASARGDEDVESTTTTSSSSQLHSARDIVMELTYKRTQPKFTQK